MTEFNELELHQDLVQTVADLGYTEPTPIQAEVIPLMLEGLDVIGQAQTGTGKTAAFALPMIHKIEPGQRKVQGLVLAPTRELAMQVAQATHKYGERRGTRVLAIYGGTPYGRQKSRLRKGVDIVAGTPGRVLDLIKQNALDLSEARMVVLDEADEMLSMGFVEDIEAILESTPSDRQTTLFSATLPPDIRRLANNYMQDPKSITIKKKELTVDAIEQRYYLMNSRDKLAVLTRLFETEEMTTILIFARTRVGTGELANELSNRGFQAESLNGDLSQEARERVLGRFRRGQIKVLVATDVAARGLDIDDISHVINFDLPQDPEVYVHRVGRTGRAGKTGVAISLITPGEKWRLRRIEQYARMKIERAEVPTIAEIQTYREAQMLEQLHVWLRRGRCAREREIVQELAAAGNDIVEIAAVALKLARAEEKQRPIPQIGEVREQGSRDGRRGNSRRNGRNGSSRNGGYRNGRPAAKRSHETGMVRLNLNAGKEQGIRPNDVVGTIAYHADIPGHTIGAIRIQPEHTFVDVPEKYVGKVLEKSGTYRIHRQEISVEVA